MPYIRKTPKNALYFDDERGRLERIEDVTWLTTKCAECGTQIKRKTSPCACKNKDRFYCGNACLNRSQRGGAAKTAKEDHFMKKYGVTNPGAIPEVKEQVKQTMLERYGVTNVSKIPEVSQHKSELMKRISTEGDFQERRRNTCVERYGYDWLATPESREMLKKYSLETYGVEHFMKSPVYKEQRRKKFFARHGVDNPLQLNEVKEKVRQTCLKKYGVDNVFKRPELIEKRIMKLVENAKRFSSDGEDRIFEQLSQHFKHVERHVPIFYRKSLFWIVDFKISDVYVQYDGLYWHGVNMDVSELKTLREQGDRSADMQIKAIHRDRFQNYWFIENDLKLFRIIEGTSIDEWLPKLQAFIDHPPCA